MQRTVSSHLAFDVAAPAELVLSIAVADGAWERNDQLTVTHEDAELDVVEVKMPHGARIHRVNAPAGRVVVDYRAVVHGQDDPPAINDGDLLEYLRPSRYAESDRLFAFARDQFAGLSGVELLHAIDEWVGHHLVYVSGSSLPTDGATDTLLKRRGVCRDFAHLVTALLRACDVPARTVSVYGPGLKPMDFHAVVEAYVDGGWAVVDSTRLAPRETLVRIATGRDATDTAFLSTYGGAVNLRTVNVTAKVSGGAPQDDGSGIVALR